MSDTTTDWNVSQSVGDWTMQGVQLGAGKDLQTAVLISLFTDRTAGTDDIINDGTTDPRGWCGDLGADYKIGSRLWLLNRAKQTNETLARANGYITEALQWLIDDGVVVKFDITTEWTRASMLGVKIIAYRQDGTKMAMSYEWVWKGLN